MEINGKNPLMNLDANVQRLDYQQQQKRSQGTAEESPRSDADRIELSVKSREIQQLDAMIRSTPDVRIDKVEQLRSAVQNGTYNVKAEMIADKIIGGNVIDEVF